MKKNEPKAPAPGPSLGAIPAHILADAKAAAKGLIGERIALFYDSGADHEEYFGYGPESAVDLLFNKHLGFVLGYVDRRGNVVEAAGIAENAARVALLNPYRPAEIGKVYERDADGSAYYFKGPDLMCAPLSADGKSPRFYESEAVAVADFDEPLGAEEMAEVLAALAPEADRVAEGGAL